MDAAGVGAATGERGEDHSVGKMEIANSERAEQLEGCGHGEELYGC